MAIKHDKLRNLLGLLKMADAQAFDQLSWQLRGPGAALPVGGTLGSGAIAQEFSMLEACTIAARSLERIRKIATPAINIVGKRLRASNTIGLVGEIVAAIGTAGVITAIWGAPPKDSVGHITSIWLAVLALAGTAASLVARYLRRDITGADGSLAAVYRKLVDGTWEADILGAKLEVVIIKGEDCAMSKEAASMIERAEKLAADLYRTVNETGVDIGQSA